MSCDNSARASTNILSLVYQFLGITPHSSCFQHRLQDGKEAVAVDRVRGGGGGGGGGAGRGGGEGDGTLGDEDACVGDDGCSCIVDVDMGLGFTDVLVAA